MTFLREWRSYGARLCVLVLFMLVFSVALRAQVESDKIVGTVRDASGATLPGAVVTVMATETSRPSVVTTARIIATSSVPPGPMNSPLDQESASSRAMGFSGLITSAGRGRELQLALKLTF